MIKGECPWTWPACGQGSSAASARGELTIAEQQERWHVAKVLHNILQQLLVSAKL